MSLEPRTRPQQFLDALAVFTVFMGAMLGLGSTSDSAPPAMAWVAGGMVAAAAVAKAGSALLTVRWTVQGDRLVLQGRMGVSRQVPVSELAAIGVSGTKVAVGSGGYVEHGPAFVTRDGSVHWLRKPESGAQGYERAVTAAEDVAARTGVPLHPPEQARTLDGSGGAPAYGPLRQDVVAFLMALAAVILVFGTLVAADMAVGLGPVSPR